MDLTGESSPEDHFQSASQPIKVPSDSESDDGLEQLDCSSISRALPAKTCLNPKCDRKQNDQFVEGSNFCSYECLIYSCKVTFCKMFNRPLDSPDHET
ncbi:hypothetical protein Ciccas_011556 [Cichlidogyrus casuarinus]|uniref:Uncharacterized protein n=1 Tax=Cichlidogyrus casuarinus TaxID=1844966 RepID=A0ABD2PRB8_9PLAT